MENNTGRGCWRKGGNRLVSVPCVHVAVHVAAFGQRRREATRVGRNRHEGVIKQLSGCFVEGIDAGAGITAAADSWGWHVYNQNDNWRRPNCHRRWWPTAQERGHPGRGCLPNGGPAGDTHEGKVVGRGTQDRGCRLGPGRESVAALQRASGQRKNEREAAGAGSRPRLPGVTRAAGEIEIVIRKSSC